MATILIVDDLAGNRRLLVRLLGAQGHRLIEAADGREGLAVLRAEMPDLVITDVLMPVMDGYEFVRQLQGDPATAGIPVVFYTAHYGEREARALALAGGVSDVLTKPATSAEVLRVVDGALSGQREMRRPAGATPLTTDFDREHLRLLTDKVSEKAGDLRTANSRLRALINIALDFGADGDSGPRLQTVCASARDLFGATYVTLGLLNETDHTVDRLVTSGVEDTPWIAPGEAVEGLLATVVANRRVVRGDNSSGDPARLGLPPLHPEVRIFLAAPIASAAHVYGWICLVRNEGLAFTEDDEHLVTALSGQVGRIYELEREILERQRAESALRTERDRAERYLSTAEVILLALDRDGRVTLINRHGCDLLGWSVEELVGRNWFDTCLPGRVRDVLEAGFPSLLKGPLSIVESPVLTRFGEERLIEWRHTVLQGDAGDVAGTFSSGSDITERARAEEEIRQRARLSALTATIGLSLTEPGAFARALQQCTDVLVTHLDAAFARIWLLNEPEGVLELKASAGMYTRLNGAHGRVALGKPPIGRIAQDRRPYLTSTVADDPHIQDQEWARREGIVGFAGHPLIVDGRVVGVMAVFTRHPLTDPVVSTLASVADHIALGIERHRSADALITAEERMRLALDAAGVGVWDLDYGTGVLRWSATLEAQYGLPMGAFAGTFESFIDRVHPDDRTSVIDTVRKAERTGADFTVQNRVVSSDGGERWLRGGGRVHLGANGEPVRGVGISMDITDTRRLEEQYQQAQTMEAIGRLAGGVANDFNNRLAVILGHCELLLTDMEPDDSRQSTVLEIQRAGEDAAGLTEQLLGLSPAQTAEPALLNLNNVVRDLRPALAALFDHGVECAVLPAPDLDPVTANRGQLEQIVMSLALNARDAMPNGGTFRIETANVELDEFFVQTHFAVKPGRYVVLAVTDTGTGMATAVLSRLFEPFFTTKAFGRGLGLATVRGLAARAGGSVNVYSEIGIGTSFKVYFPSAGPHQPVAEARPVAPGGATARTVLVVEDADGLRQLARTLLQRQGYTVLVAANADEAILVFEQNASIDLLLTDIVMPGASGPELTRQLIKRRPGLKVIYMSGYTQDAIIQRGILMPGVAFLHKPFSSDTLGRKVREALEG